MAGTKHIIAFYRRNQLAVVIATALGGIVISAIGECFRLDCGTAIASNQAIMTAIFDLVSSLSVIWERTRAATVQTLEPVLSGTPEAVSQMRHAQNHSLTHIAKEGETYWDILKVYVEEMDLVGPLRVQIVNALNNMILPIHGAGIRHIVLGQKLSLLIDSLGWVLKDCLAYAAEIAIRTDQSVRELCTYVMQLANPALGVDVAYLPAICFAELFLDKFGIA